MRTERDIKERQRRQRQAMIEEAIDMGSFDDRHHFKAWMKKEFGLKLPVEEISTEYSLTPKQKNLLYVWLRYFTGRGQKPNTHRSSSRLSNKQLHRLDELFTLLGYSPDAQVDFIQRQTGKRKLGTALFKDEATKVITGLERIFNEQKYHTHART
jgi:hypothetical protein